MSFGDRWNPQVEKQAINRCHRLGQQRHVEVVRFTVANSVEQKMVALQQKKAQLADDILSTDRRRKNANRLGLAELKLMFS